MAKRNNTAEFELKNIHSCYPFINLHDIEVFSPVYYPLARIEADMKEKTFEDFDAVQEAVLRFVSLGFKDENAIAELMALNSDYISKMLKLLFSYDHIDRQCNITELGKLSLSEGQKITIAFTKQVFLLDALNCNIIRVDKDVDRTIIERTEEMERHDKYIAFLDHAAGIQKSDIESTLKTEQYNTLKRMDGGMNINVVEVSGVRCLGIRYIRSYLLKLKGHEPVIFVKRYDPSKKGREQYYYMPFSVKNHSERDFFKLPDLQLHRQSVDDMIIDAYNRILENGSNEHMKEQLEKKFDFFAKEYFHLKLDKYDKNITLSSTDFGEYRKSILRILEAFGKDGIYPLVDDGLSGNVIFFYPNKNDTLLRSCSEYVVKALEKHTYTKVTSHIAENIAKDKNPIEEINNILKKLLG